MKEGERAGEGKLQQGVRLERSPEALQLVPLWAQNFQLLHKQLLALALASARRDFVEPSPYGRRRHRLLACPGFPCIKEKGRIFSADANHIGGEECIAHFCKHRAEHSYSLVPYSHSLLMISPASLDMHISRSRWHRCSCIGVK